MADHVVSIPAILNEIGIELSRLRFNSAWKPGDAPQGRRARLITIAAMLVGQVEQIDRAAEAKPPQEKAPHG